MAHQNIAIAKRVELLAAPIAQKFNVSIWDVKYLKEGASWFLRIFIDKDDGVSLDDCENVSRAIDPILDEENFIEEAYYLEVSSPGLERTLSRPEHFAAFIGASVIVKLYKAHDGLKEFVATMQSCNEETLSLMV